MDLALIAKILLEGLKAFNREDRSPFEKQYHEILNKLNKAKNYTGTDYTDSAVSIARQDWKTFLEAYYVFQRRSSK